MSPKNTCACMEKSTGGKTSGTRRGTIPCSTTQVDILRHQRHSGYVKKKKKTKSEKRRRLFLHDGALALASKVSSRYYTVPLLHRRCLSPVLTSVPEWRYFSVVLRYTNNHHHPYIDDLPFMTTSFYRLFFPGVLSFLNQASRANSGYDVLTDNGHHTPYLSVSLTWRIQAYFIRGKYFPRIK